MFWNDDFISSVTDLHEMCSSDHEIKNKKSFLKLLSDKLSIGLFLFELSSDFDFISFSSSSFSHGSVRKVYMKVIITVMSFLTEFKVCIYVIVIIMCMDKTKSTGLLLLLITFL